MKVLKGAPNGVMDWDKAWETLRLPHQPDTVPPGWLRRDELMAKLGVGKLTLRKWLRANVGKTVEEATFRVKCGPIVVPCLHYRPLVKGRK